MSACAKLHTRSSSEKKLFTDALKVRPNDDHMTLIISWQYLIICAFVFMHTYTFNRIRNLKFCVTTAKRRHTLWSAPIILADTRCSHKHFNRVKFYPIYLLVYYIHVRNHSLSRPTAAGGRSAKSCDQVIGLNHSFPQERPVG